MLLKLPARSIADKRLLRLIGATCAPGCWLESTLNPAKWAHHRVGHSRHCWQTSCCPSSTKSWSGGDTVLHVMLSPYTNIPCGLFVTGEGTGLEAWRALQGDDMVTLVKSERAAQRVMYSITLYLETTLKLKVNLVKSKVAPMSECAFQSLSFGNASLPITLRIAATALPSKGASALSIASGG